MIELIRARAPWVWLSVSVTTRRIRDYEIDGVHYHFVDRAEFERLVDAGAAAGVGRVRRQPLRHPARRRCEARLAAGQPVLLKIDLQGARQVRAAMPEAQLVFLAPPSWEELKRRLVGRGTDDAETIRRRLEHAQEELAAEPEFDVTVVNHSVEQAADELARITRLTGHSLRHSSRDQADFA